MVAQPVASTRAVPASSSRESRQTSEDPAGTSWKKGNLVKLDRAAYLASPCLAASDQDAPDYLFEGPGEILKVHAGSALIRWHRPVPDVWLPMELLRSA